MNRDDILRMAREQGLPETETEGVFRVNTDDLGRMIAAEREACAKVCEETTAAWTQYLYNSGCVDCAEAIRARGEKP